MGGVEMTYHDSGSIFCGRSIDYRDLRFRRVPVRCDSSRGSPYVRWIDTCMPQIPSQFLHCAFHLYASAEDANKGKDTGGTGFLVSMPTDDGLGHHYGVTNYHVAVSGGYSCIRLNTVDGATDVITLGPEDWIYNSGGDDVAVVPLDLRTPGTLLTFIGVNLLFTPQACVDAKIAPGDDVFMVGRFIDLDATQTNIPSARFGNISTFPVPVVQPNNHTGECYCIDMHSRTGYSGSPVFVYRTPGSSLEWALDRTATVIGPGMLGLLGVHCGQFPEELPIKRQLKKPRPESLSDAAHEEYVQGMSGMTIAVPAWRILEILNLPILVEQREKEIEMRNGERAPAARPLGEATTDAKTGDEILRAALNTPPIR